MKKVIVGLAVVLMLQAAAMAQTQVLSRNAVGYVKITAERGKLFLGRSDFEAIGGGGITVSNLFGDQVPAGTTVYLWDRVSAAYKSVTKSARGGWGAGGTNTIQRSEGFWLKIPQTASNLEYDVFLMGEVPDRFTAPTTVVSSLSGVNMLGFPYPISILWTNTQLASTSPPGSSLYLWDSTNQSYQSFTKSARGGWGGATGVVLQPGQGFWFKNTGTVTWVELKPYTWP